MGYTMGALKAKDTTKRRQYKVYLRHASERPQRPRPMARRRQRYEALLAIMFSKHVWVDLLHAFETNAAIPCQQAAHRTTYSEPS